MQLLSDSGPLVQIGEEWLYFKGTSEPPGPAMEWSKPGYGRLETWLRSPGPFGAALWDDPRVGRVSEAEPLADRAGLYGTVYFRKEIFVSDPASIRWLVLRMDYRDGFAVFINGRECLRRNLPVISGPHVPHTTPGLTRKDTGAVEFNLGSGLQWLKKGSNHLAIEMHSDRMPPLTAGDGGAEEGDGELLFVPELVANFVRGPLVQSVTTDSAHVRVWTPVSTTLQVDYGLSSEFGQTAPSNFNGADHDILITRLQPGTRYFYRVRAQAGPVEALSVTNEFRTMPASGPIRFQVIGNTGGSHELARQLTTQMERRPADFVLHSGDIMAPYFFPARVDDRYFSAFGRRMGTIPFYFTAGSKDIPGGDAGRFLRSFSMPTNGWDVTDLWNTERTFPDAYYSFDAGDVHVVCLYLPGESHYRFTRDSIQYKWLEADLAATRKPWKILIGNASLLGAAATDLEEQRAEEGEPVGTVGPEALLFPLAERFGVASIFTGNTTGYERFSPVGGVFEVSSGGGGAPLERGGGEGVRSALFLPRHHFLDVTIEDQVMTIRAIGLDGQVMDVLEVARARPRVEAAVAAWSAPYLPVDLRYLGDTAVEPAVPWFSRWAMQESVAPPVESVSGLSANLGRLYTAWNGTNLFLGMNRLMLSPDTDLGVFIAVPHRAGITNMQTICAFPEIPGPPTVYGLEALHHLSFSNFSPCLALLLGDPESQETDRLFQKRESIHAGGQGAFWLSKGFPNAQGVRFRQGLRDVPDAIQSSFRNAETVEISIPVCELGGLSPGDTIWVGVVALGPVASEKGLVRAIDTGFLGEAFKGGGVQPSWLQAVAIQLPPERDSDDDGLSDVEEVALGTDPLIADSDADGLLDGWEVMHGLNPLSGTGLSGAFGDPDGDCVSNLEEQAAGTFPELWEPPRLHMSVDPSGALVFDWVPCEGGDARLMTSQNLGGPYEEYTLGVVTNSPMEVRIKYPMDSGTRFFRLGGMPKASIPSTRPRP